MPLYFIAKLFHLFEGQILLKNRHAETCRFLVGEDGFEPSKRRRNRFTVCPLWPLGNSPIFNYKMELADGFEPPTC